MKVHCPNCGKQLKLHEEESGDYNVNNGKAIKYLAADCSFPCWSKFFVEKKKLYSCAGEFVTSLKTR